MNLLFKPSGNWQQDALLQHLAGSEKGVGFEDLRRVANVGRNAMNQLVTMMVATGLIEESQVGWRRFFFLVCLRERAFHALAGHAWLGKVYKRMGTYELALCKQFIYDHRHLDTGAFDQAINRWWMDVGEAARPKRWREMNELLSCANSAVHVTAGTAGKEQIMPKQAVKSSAPRKPRWRSVPDDPKLMSTKRLQEILEQNGAYCDMQHFNTGEPPKMSVSEYERSMEQLNPIATELDRRKALAKKPAAEHTGSTSTAGTTSKELPMPNQYTVNQAAKVTHKAIVAKGTANIKAATKRVRKPALKATTAKRAVLPAVSRVVIPAQPAVTLKTATTAELAGPRYFAIRTAAMGGTEFTMLRLTDTKQWPKEGGDCVGFFAIDKAKEQLRQWIVAERRRLADQLKAIDKMRMADFKG